MKQFVIALFIAAIFVCGVFPPVSPAVAASDGASVSASLPVNINTAAAPQLDVLPGVGKAIAERIVAYRSEHGPFHSVDDLANVKGIGKKTLEKLRKMITVE